MKCYYEELGVSRDANDADIKTAYRKLALRWHPDKNPDSLDEAKERFQLIQQAYEVLSDPQERAWYDNHRDQILRGKNSEYTENCLDVFEYFTSSCFRGYGDDEKGFYSVYRQVFEKIAAEDAEFIDDEDEVEQIPTFGDSKSSYEDVVAPFYAYWQAYCTKKTYTWLCPYNVKEIRDRRVLREVEKEMKKIMQKARKERNEEVRNLVSFIRKRDKRVQAYRKVLEERAELNRKKQEQNRLEQIRKRQRELEEMRANHKQHNQNNDEYETLLKQLAQDYSDSSAEEDSETDDDEDEGDENEVLESGEEDFYVDDLYCVACNKAFTNERAYANHESSKKHREALERMILEMQAEEEALQPNNDAEEEVESEELVDNGAEEVEKEVQRQTEEFVEAAIASVTLEAKEEEEPASRKAKKNKKARKNVKLNKSQKTIEDDEQEETVSADFLAQAKIADSDEEDWNSSGKKSARKNKNKKQVKKASMEDEKANLSEQNAKVTEKHEDKVTILQKEIDEVSETVAADVVVKKTQPKAKSKDVEESTATTNVCVTCKATFPSKNKLFNHLKITNHGVYIPKAKTEVNAASAEGKSKKGKGKKK
ncbi:PREDICTED: dnaJ homolog subfamily C member 21 [Rhagoletis zephyria]|uniref:dnaJ homolog subfamily C member 21 n=1 Tax=Rhagoletis zephyria TaxID=28612 RepID=UPI00081159C5|nr:PREDICTED: dnaJ homolog subfamily C member 21 [Rhagoletis zephyria]